MNQPPEVLCLIFGSLPKWALFDVRLVCKSFEQAANPFLFDQLYISEDKADLKIANLTVIRFGRHIRTLILSSAEYQVLTLASFRERLRVHYGGYWSAHTSTELFNQHLEYGWKRYTGQCAEWQEVVESGELIGHLCFVFSKIPSLQKVAITRFPNMRHRLLGSLNASDSPRPCLKCPTSECDLSNIDFDIEPGFGFEAKSARPWHAMMLALSITGIRVKKIMSENSRSECDHPLTYSAFDMSQTQALHLQNVFRYLSKLRLTLTGYEYVDGTLARCSCASGNVANALARATELEKLQIVFSDYDDRPDFQAMLGGCTFPKLRSLAISSIESTEDELASFLKGSPCLENLELHCYDLTLGSWEQMANRIKALLCLKKVSLTQIFGGLHEPLSDNDDSSWSHVVEDFFLRNGTNPFTKEALERQHAENPFPVSCG